MKFVFVNRDIPRIHSDSGTVTPLSAFSTESWIILRIAHLKLSQQNRVFRLHILIDNELHLGADTSLLGLPPGIENVETAKTDMR